MAKKTAYRNQVRVNRTIYTVDTQRIRARQRESLDWYYSATCHGDLNISSLIGDIHHISRMEFKSVGAILMTMLAASGMGGDDGSIAGIADDPITGHPVIKSLTHTDHDIDIAITTDSIRPNSKPDCSANYYLGRSGTWWYHHIARRWLGVLGCLTEHIRDW